MLTSTAILCLTLNVYHESKGEPELGQQAVAHVTLNRTEDKSKLCDTVYAPYQFSWTRHKSKKRRIDKSSDEWLNAYQIARRAYNGKSQDPTLGATHFHAKHVSPKWRHKLRKTKQIGNHIFYK